MKQKLILAKAFVGVAEVVGILPLSPWTVTRWRTKGIGPRYCRLVGRALDSWRHAADFIRSLPNGGGAPVSWSRKAG